MVFKHGLNRLVRASACRRRLRACLLVATAALVALPPHGGVPLLLCMRYERRQLFELAPAADVAADHFQTLRRIGFSRGRLHCRRVLVLHLLHLGSF